jgi:hypothetical protein
MRFTILVLWRLVCALILLIPTTTCFDPQPLCHPNLVQNLNRIHCLQAIEHFKTYVDTTLSRSFESYEKKQR